MTELAAHRGGADRDEGRVREVLRARARLLARPVRGEVTSAGNWDVLEFKLSKERYAIEQSMVREVVPLRDLTPLPCTPPFVSGIVSIRGHIVAVIDIKTLFDLPASGIADLHVVIVLKDEDADVGILADVVVGMRSVRPSDCQPSLPALTGTRARYVKGVTDDHVVILDAAAILADPALVVNDGPDAPN